MSAAEVIYPDLEEELARDLAEIRQLVESHQIEEARRLAPEVARKWPDSARAQKWAHVLAPPRSWREKSGVHGRSFQEEHRWLGKHAPEYPGQWLAVYGDRLIAAGPDLKEVVAATRAELGEEPALLHFQPKS